MQTKSKGGSSEDEAVRDPEAQVAVVREQSSKAVSAAEELVIKDADGMAAATDVLAKIKKVAKMAKERKELITKPLSEALNSARDLFKPIEANCADAERIIKRKMVEYDDAQTALAAATRLKLAKQVETGYIKPKTAVARIAAVQEAPRSVQAGAAAMAFRSVKKVRIAPLAETQMDEAQLRHCVANGYLVWNEPLMRADALKGSVVPGAEVYMDKMVASSSTLDADSGLLGHKQK